MVRAQNHSENRYLFYKYELSKNPIQEQTYRKIISLFFKFIGDELAKGKIIRLPEGFGEIAFIGKKYIPKPKPSGHLSGSIDWKSTLALWKENPKAKEDKVYLKHFNEHTNNIRYKFKWFRKTANLRNKQYYHFIPCRTLKRRFGRILFNNESEFHVL